MQLGTYAYSAPCPFITSMLPKFATSPVFCVQHRQRSGEARWLEEGSVVQLQSRSGGQARHRPPSRLVAAPMTYRHSPRNPF